MFRKSSDSAKSMHLYWSTLKVSPQQQKAAEDGLGRIVTAMLMRRMVEESNAAEQLTLQSDPKPDAYDTAIDILQLQIAECRRMQRESRSRRRRIEEKLRRADAVHALAA
jgi:hypothetical protein